MSNAKKRIIGDEILPGALLNSQYFMESIRGFLFVAQM